MEYIVITFTWWTRPDMPPVETENKNIKLKKDKRIGHIEEIAIIKLITS